MLRKTLLALPWWLELILVVLMAGWLLEVGTGITPFLALLLLLWTVVRSIKAVIKMVVRTRTR